MKTEIIKLLRLRLTKDEADRLIKFGIVAAYTATTIRKDEKAEELLERVNSIITEAAKDLNINLSNYGCMSSFKVNIISEILIDK